MIFSTMYLSSYHSTHLVRCRSSGVFFSQNCFTHASWTNNISKERSSSFTDWIMKLNLEYSKLTLILMIAQPSFKRSEPTSYSALMNECVREGDVFITFNLWIVPNIFTPHLYFIQFICEYIRIFIVISSLTNIFKCVINHLLSFLERIQYM